jgi:hypothetical protein
MLLDAEISNCTRRCAATDRALVPGDEYFSTLIMDRGVPVRCDFAAEAWSGPPDGVVAWWKSRLDGGDKARLAPNEVLVNLFRALADQPGEAEFRYVLGLLLLRRKVLRLIDSDPRALIDHLPLECPHGGERFELLIAAPDPTKTIELDARMTNLLYGGADGA